MSDTVNCEPITNIDDFKTAIDHIKESFRIHHGENLEFFYRGEKEEYESFGASIYRKMGKDGLQQRLKSEYKIYKEVQRMFPDDFPQEDDVLNKLVRMQHYKIPTRLIDVTSHAYVALFFACEGDESQNGKVFVFGFPQNGIAFFDDYERLLTIGLDIRVDFDGLIRDAISGCLGILDFYHWKVFFDTNKSKYKDDYLKLSSDIANRLRDSEKSEPTEAIRTLHEIENLIDFTYIELCKTATENPEDNPDMQQWPSEMQKLQEVLGGFVSSFIDNKCNQFNLPNKYSNLSRLSAFLLWFTRTMICLPRLNNERIRRQQGAFIIQPPFADFNKLSSLFNPSMFRLSITIDGASKKDILDKLKEDHKITRSYLFPELESSAPDIVEKFIPNYYE